MWPVISRQRSFVVKTGIPVAQTLLGLGGFPATHPLSLGMMGMHGEAWVNHAIQEADLLIALGMRFDDRVTGKLETYAQNAKKIHCELDPAEITDATRFREDLDADSLDLYELVMELEDTYGIGMNEEEAAKIETVGQAVDFVHERLPGAPGG